MNLCFGIPLKAVIINFLEQEILWLWRANFWGGKWRRK